MVKVSVIVPAYNSAATLQATMESVLAQTFRDFELLIINDGSTDATAQVAQQVGETTGDHRIRLLHYDNGGLATARNRGIAAAQGQLLTFLDADDLWTPDKLTDQVAALEAQPEAAVAYSWTDYIDLQGNVLYPGGRGRYSGDVYTTLFQKNFIESGSNLMVRASALEQVGVFEAEAIAVTEDWDLWLRLAMHYPFVLVPKAQILYRVMPQSLSSNFQRQERDTLKVMQDALARSPEILQPHYRASLSHLYQYLTFRALSVGRTRRQYLSGLRFYGLAIFYDPQLLLKRTKLMGISLAKTLLGLILSPARLQRAIA